MARPQTTAFGIDAFDAMAAALLHSLARNHALADGNKRLALTAGEMDDVAAIAERLRDATGAR